MLAFATLLAAGCSGDDSEGQTTARRTGETTASVDNPGTITVRVARANDGPWVQSLSLEHGEDGVPTPFYVCAAWDESAPREECRAAAGAHLPSGTILRLEQRPAGAALTSPDSPGWGTVGTSDRAELSVPLSDFVSGLKVRTATYRVTLRRVDGSPALATSDLVTVTWAP